MLSELNPQTCEPSLHYLATKLFSYRYQEETTWNACQRGLEILKTWIGEITLVRLTSTTTRLSHPQSKCADKESSPLESTSLLCHNNPMESDQLTTPHAGWLRTIQRDNDVRMAPKCVGSGVAMQHTVGLWTHWFSNFFGRVKCNNDILL